MKRRVIERNDLGIIVRESEMVITAHIYQTARSWRIWGLDEKSALKEARSCQARMKREYDRDMELVNGR